MWKIFLLIEAVLFVSFMTVKNENIGTFLFCCFFVFVPILFVGYYFSKKQKDKVKKQPAYPVSGTVYGSSTEYLWISSDIANKFVRFYKEDLEENDDYHLSKKQILEDFYPGDKIYKYEPFPLDFELEGDKVYSFLDDEKVFVGSVKKRDFAKLEQSTHTELHLMPNYYKYVTDESVEAESDDSYFGLEITI